MRPYFLYIFIAFIFLGLIRSTFKLSGINDRIEKRNERIESIYKDLQ